MSVLSDTYPRQKPKQEQSAPALATWLVLAVSVLAAAQSVYFDVRLQNNYAASVELNGTMSLLAQRQRKQIADFDYAIAKLFREFAGLWREWSDIDDPPNTTGGLRERIIIGLKVGKLLAAQSPSTWDDELLVTLDQVLTNDAVLDLVASLLGRMLSTQVKTVAALGASESAVQLDLQALGANWGRILEVVELLFAIWQIFRGEAI